MILFAQDSTIGYIDSAVTTPPKKVRKKVSLKPTGDFDQRFSFISEKNVSIWGYRLGVLVNDKYKVGIGGYTLKTALDSNYSTVRTTTNVKQANQKLNFGTIYFEPFLFRKKRWEMSLVFELGYGVALIDSTLITRIGGTRPRTTVFKQKEDREEFIPMGMGLSMNFIIPDMKGWHWLTYLGLNGMIGMRTVIRDSNFKQNYDGYYWSIGTAIFIDRIFTDITKKKKRKKLEDSLINH